MDDAELEKRLSELPNMPGLGGGGGSLTDLAGADAQAALSQALVRWTVQLNSGGFRAAIFLNYYLGDTGREIVEQVLSLKHHQNPGAGRRIVETLKALSLYEYLRGFNLNIGGK